MSTASSSVGPFAGGSIQIGPLDHRVLPFGRANLVKEGQEWTFEVPNGEWFQVTWVQVEVTDAGDSGSISLTASIPHEGAYPVRIPVNQATAAGLPVAIATKGKLVIKAPSNTGVNVYVGGLRYLEPYPIP